MNVETAALSLQADFDRARDKLISALRSRFAGDMKPEYFDVEVKRVESILKAALEKARQYTENV